MEHWVVSSVSAGHRSGYSSVSHWGKGGKIKLRELSRKNMELSYYCSQKNCKVRSSVHCLWLASIPGASPRGHCSVMCGGWALLRFSGSCWPQLVEVKTGQCTQCRACSGWPSENTWRVARNVKEQTHGKQNGRGEGRRDETGVNSDEWERTGFHAPRPSLPLLSCICKYQQSLLCLLVHHDVQFLRPFTLLSPRYIPHIQPSMMAAFAVPFGELVHWGSEMLGVPEVT